MRIDYYHFDLHGNRLGYVDSVGHYFDPAGQYRGSLSDDGYLCDEYGAACGRVDAQGQMWDEEDSYRGYLVRAMEEDRQHQRLAAMGAAVARVVHDLGNSMSGLALQAEVILRRLQNECTVATATIRAPAEQILSTVHHVDGYVKALLDFARDRPLQLQPLHLGPFLQEIVALWQPTAAAQTISLGLRVEDTAQVLADVRQLRRVFDNLVKNAIEAIGDGPGSVDVTVAPKAETIEISIEDTGPGATDSHRLFRPFYTTKCSGTGLGLTVAKQIVEAHSGRISYAQRRPHGAVFRIALLRHAPLDTAARYDRSDLTRSENFTVPPTGFTSTATPGRKADEGRDDFAVA